MAAWKLGTVLWQLILWFSLQNSFLKVPQNRRFSALASRSGFWSCKIAARKLGFFTKSMLRSRSPVGSNECWNRDPMERRFNGAEQESLQPSHFNWTEKKLDRCNWGAMSQHELKGVEMKRKRWKESRRTVPKSETRAQKFRKDDGGLPQLLQAKLVFGSATLLKPGNFRHPARPGSTSTSHKSQLDSNPG